MNAKRKAPPWGAFLFGELTDAMSKRFLRIYRSSFFHKTPYNKFDIKTLHLQ